MYIHEEVFNLLSVPSNYWIAHCISADFKLCAGIAATIDARYNVRSYLFQTHHDYYDSFNQGDGDVLYGGYRIINLVTKKNYYNKPTLSSMQKALRKLKSYIIDNNIRFLAIPRIGCGLDKLSWKLVKELIISELYEIKDLDIMVCNLK